MLKSDLFSSYLQDLEDKISEEIGKNYIHGLMISLFTDQDILFSKGFGYTDSTSSQNVSDETLIGLQSSTKTFTALIFLRAVELGLVKLDDRVIEYYHDFKIKDKQNKDLYKDITFRMLLNHNAGLPTTTIKGGCFNEEVCSFEERIKTIKEIYLIGTPGKSKHYSNIGFDLVAYCIQLIAGRDYANFIMEELLRPLGIEQMFFKSSVVNKIKNSFHGYLGKEESAYILNDNGFGCGTGFISHRDLIKFIRFILRRGKTESGKILISDYLFDEFYNGKVGDYGLGVFIENFQGYKMYHHPGGGFGFLSYMNWIPELNLGLLINSNQEYQEFTSTLTNQLFKNYIKAYCHTEMDTFIPQIESKPTLHPSPSVLSKLDGFYQGIYGKLKIIYENEKLLVRVFGKKYQMDCKGGDLENELVFMSEVSKYTRFLLSGDKILIEFFLNSWNKKMVYYHLQPATDESKKVTKDYSSYVGIYKTNYYISEINLLLFEQKKGELYLEDPLLYYTDRIFNKETGEFVELFDNYIRVDNAKATKIDNVVEYFTNLSKQNPKHRQLKPWILDDASVHLKKLQKVEESEKILELKEKIFGKKEKE